MPEEEQRLPRRASGSALLLCVRPPHWEVTQAPFHSGAGSREGSRAWAGKQRRCVWERAAPGRATLPSSECNIFMMTSAASKIRSRRGQCRKVQGRSEGHLVPKDHSNPLASRKRWPSGRQETELVPLLLVPCLFTYDMRWWIWFLLSLLCLKSCSEVLTMSKLLPISKWPLGILAHDWACLWLLNLLFLGKSALNDELTIRHPPALSSWRPTSPSSQAITSGLKARNVHYYWPDFPGWLWDRVEH